MNKRICSFIFGAALALCAGMASGATFNLFSPASGVLKGNPNTYVTSAAVSSDIRGLWSGTCNSTTFLRADGICSIAHETDPQFNTLRVGSGLPSPGTNNSHLAGTLTVDGITSLNAVLQESASTGTNIFSRIVSFRNSVALEILNSAGSYLDFENSLGNYGTIGQTSVASGGGVAGQGLAIFSAGTQDLVLGNYSGGFGKEVLRVQQSNRSVTCKSDVLGYCFFTGAASNDLHLGANLTNVALLNATSGRPRFQLYNDNAAAIFVTMSDATLFSGIAGHFGIMAESGAGIELGTQDGGSNYQIRLSADAHRLDYTGGNAAARFVIGSTSTSSTLDMVDSNASADTSSFRLFNDAGTLHYRTCTDAFSCTDYLSIVNSAGSPGAMTLGASSVALPAATQINAKNVCLADGTNCPGGAGAFSGAGVHATGTTTCGVGSYCAIAYAAEDYDTGSFHDNVTNNPRILLPSGTGFAQCTASVTILTGTTSASSLHAMEVIIATNGPPGGGGGTTYGQASQNFFITSAGSTFVSTMTATTGPIPVSGGDYAQAFFDTQGFSSSGSVITSTAGSPNRFWCWAVK